MNKLSGHYCMYIYTDTCSHYIFWNALIFTTRCSSLSVELMVSSGNLYFIYPPLNILCLSYTLRTMFYIYRESIMQQMLARLEATNIRVCSETSTFNLSAWCWIYFFDISTANVCMQKALLGFKLQMNTFMTRKISADSVRYNYYKRPNVQKYTIM